MDFFCWMDQERLEIQKKLNGTKLGSYWLSWLFSLNFKEMLPEKVQIFLGCNSQAQDLKFLFFHLLFPFNFMFERTLNGKQTKGRTSCTSFVRCNDMWLAKDNRFMNPMSTYEWNLMAPTCLIINYFSCQIPILACSITSSSKGKRFLWKDSNCLSAHRGNELESAEEE